MRVKQSVLVVGGLGYIGSHVTKLLLEKHYSVVVLDNLSTGHKFVSTMLDAPFYEGTAGNSALVKQIFRKHSVDTVMHFAAKAQVGESVSNPLLYFNSNVAETISLLSTMNEENVKTFIFSSTCATYGEPKQIPIYEDIAQSPINPYGESKWMVEKILKNLTKAHHFKSSVLRYFNAAGADPQGILGEDHRPETHLIPLAIKSAMGTNPPLTVFGNDYPTKDGSCVRDYIHVNDLGNAHILAMEYLNKKTSPEYIDFNLGSENGYSVFEILKTIENVVKKPVPHSVGDRRAGDPPVLIGDSSKAKKILGWNPRFGLEEIVQTTAQWIAKNPNGYPGA